MSDRREIECTECGSTGVAEYFEGCARPCDACHGEGWRLESDEEANDRAADAFSDMCEGEPPISFSERCEMDAKRDNQWENRA